ncbi:hypothetical protein Q1W71_15495 [Flavobacterium pectinovorum]|uniref:hypothetical protein n=1 Tax=Flavobacterium pectinovorum TaxID=29533 RepID=UPI00265DB6C3|nr:hypothetical protein [Flavobacterium pectinovorum]WKL46357.1 hypothetical protein Q1W71_15495 [Flavobacterium pectinovorum]
MDGKNDEANSENFRMFYLLQYDRIDKLETKRENYSNYVITMSSAIYTVGFAFLEKLNFSHLNVLGLFVIVVNLVAILFIWKTRPWVKLHQMRAKIALERYANEFSTIIDEAKKEVIKKYKGGNSLEKYYNKYTYFYEGDKDYFRRSRIYSYLHILIIILTLVSILTNYNIVDSKKHSNKKETCKCVENQ